MRRILLAGGVEYLRAGGADALTAHVLVRVWVRGGDWHWFELHPTHC